MNGVTPFSPHYQEKDTDNTDDDGDYSFVESAKNKTPAHPAPSSRREKQETEPSGQQNIASYSDAEDRDTAYPVGSEQSVESPKSDEQTGESATSKQSTTDTDSTEDSIGSDPDRPGTLVAGEQSPTNSNSSEPDSTDHGAPETLVVSEQSGTDPNSSEPDSTGIENSSEPDSTDPDSTNRDSTDPHSLADRRSGRQASEEFEEFGVEDHSENDADDPDTAYPVVREQSVESPTSKRAGDGEDGHDEGDSTEQATVDPDGPTPTDRPETLVAGEQSGTGSFAESPDAYKRTPGTLVVSEQSIESGTDTADTTDSNSPEPDHSNSPEPDSTDPGHSDDPHELFADDKCSVSSGSPEPIECAGDRLSTPLTTDPKKARALRARTDDDDHPLLDNGKPVTLEDAAVRYDRKMRGEAANKRFGNSHAGKARKNYGRILEADRRLRPNMDDPHLVLISLRGSPCDENGEWLPVLDFLEKLNQSMDNVRRSLNYALQDHESEWCAVLAGNSYYATPHWHYLAWVDGEVDACDFSGVVDSHVRNSPVASEDRHPVEPTVVVASESDMQIEPQNQEDRRRGAVSPLARYVATQLPHINAGDRSEQQRQHGAAMWAYAGQSARLGGLSSSASAPPSPPEPDTSEPNSPGSNSREIEREKSDANSSFAFKKESQKAHADGGERSPGRKDGEPPPPG